MPENIAPESKRRWVDTTVSLQGLLGGLIGAITAVAVAWFGLAGRVQALEQRDVEHEARFTRIENDMRQQRQDVKEQLSAIGEDVKEIRRYLMDNAAGARPDIKRWSR